MLFGRVIFCTGNWVHNCIPCRFGVGSRGGVSLWSTFFETGDDVDSVAFGCLVSLFEPDRCCLEG